MRRVLRRWAIGLACAYLVICVMMWLLENKLVFQATPASVYWEPAPDAQIQDVQFTSAAGNSIHGWWLPREPNDPTLLICHGNAGNVSGRGLTMLHLRERLGVSVLIFDYPGYGKSTGRPSESSCYDSADAAIAWLKSEKQILASRVILFGESLGGGVATEMAVRHDPLALVLVKTFTLLPAAAKFHYPWLPCHWLMSNRFDNIAKLPRVHCPVFIASATRDQVVPYEHGEALFRAANEPKHFFRDEGSDHNDEWPDQFTSELAAFLKK